MKNILLFALILITISIFSYFPGFKFIVQNSFGAKFVQKSYAHNIDVQKSRDFKLPEYTENENTPYSAHQKFKNIAAIGNFDSTHKSEWNGSSLVVIDPGHGGAESGANVSGISEKDINLDVALKLAEILEEQGIDTFLTRNDDTALEPKSRIYMADEKDAALFISIHSNWFKDSSLNGTLTLYYPSDSLHAGNLSEIEYARIIQNELVTYLGAKDRGIIDRPNLAVLRHANMPSVMVELGFMSNDDDLKLLSSESYRQKAAEALAEGIKKSLSKIPVR